MQSRRRESSDDTRSDEMQAAATDKVDLRRYREFWNME